MGTAMGIMYVVYLAAILLVCLAAALVIIRGVSRLLRESWGRVLVGTAFIGLLVVCASLFLKAQLADQTARDFDDACRYAMDLALMYRLDSERKSASQSQRPELEMKLLATCSLVKHDDQMARFGPTRMVKWPEFPGSAYRLAGSAYRLDRALRDAAQEAGSIAFDLLEHPSSDRIRREASELVVCSDSRDARVLKALSSSVRDQPGGASVDLDERGDRLVDFGLAEIYYARGEYKNALKTLESAFGEDWAATGRVDKWWQLYLPLTKEDHLRFGYLFYLTDQSDRALREYRLAKGVDQTPYDMVKAYTNVPAAPTTGGR